MGNSGSKTVHTHCACAAGHAQVINSQPAVCYNCQFATGSRQRNWCSDCLLAVLTIIMPPAVAYIKTGHHDLTLNILLTLLCWVPGWLHAWYLIIINPGFHQRGPRQQIVVYQQGPVIEAQQQHNQHQVTTPAQQETTTTLPALPAPQSPRLSQPYVSAKEEKNRPPVYSY